MAALEVDGKGQRWNENKQLFMCGVWFQPLNLKQDPREAAAMAFPGNFLCSPYRPQSPNPDTWKLQLRDAVNQWLSTLLVLWSFNSFSCCGNPTRTFISLLLHICICSVMNHKVNIRYAGYLICHLQWGQDPQVESCCSKYSVSDREKEECGLLHKMQFVA